jgi:hypothetical protein
VPPTGEIRLQLGVTDEAAVRGWLDRPSGTGEAANPASKNEYEFPVYGVHDLGLSAKNWRCVAELMLLRCDVNSIAAITCDYTAARLFNAPLLISRGFGFGPNSKS